MAQCLVSGAAGFIGFHLCDELLRRGNQVIGVDNLNSYYSQQLKLDRLSQLNHKDFHFQRVELADRQSVEKVFDSTDYDVVFHLAAQAGVRHSINNPHDYVESNLVGFLNVLEACRQSEVHHLVYASSSSVYGKNKKVPFSVEDNVDAPASLYAATKRSNELIASTYSGLYGMFITGLRFFTVYGPWGRPDMAIYRFAEAMTSGQPIDVYNFGQMQRDFTYIDDIVDGVLRAASTIIDGNSNQQEGDHRIYNLGNNRPIELSHLIATLEQALGIKAKKRMLPMQPGDVYETFADIERSRKELGFEPKTTIEDGIYQFVDWYQAYHSPRLRFAA